MLEDRSLEMMGGFLIIHKLRRDRRSKQQVNIFLNILSKSQDLVLNRAVETFYDRKIFLLFSKYNTDDIL